MIELQVLLIILAIVFIGYLFIRVINVFEKRCLAEIIFYAYGVGVGAVAFQLFTYSRLGISWNPLLLIGPWLLIVLIFRNKIFPKQSILPFQKVKLRYFDKIMIVLILSLIFFVAFESIIRPVQAWDGWSSWLMKAKIYYMDGKINPSSFLYLDSEYPLTISLMSTFIYIMIGQVNDRAVLLSFFMFYFSIGAVTFFSLKNYVGLTRSLIFTFLLLSLQNIIRHGGRFEAGQADLALGYYILVSGILLMDFIKNYNIKTLILLNLFLGITSMIKNEGLPYSLFVEVLIIYHIIKIRKYNYLLPLFLWLIPLLDWQLFKIINRLPVNYLFRNFYIHTGRILDVILTISKEFINLKNWNILWLVFIASIFLPLSTKIRSVLRYLYILIFFQLIMYLFIFLITPVDATVHINNVIDRLLIHIAPSSVFSIAIASTNLNLKNYFILQKLKYSLRRFQSLF
ncbi:MAG: hypothetical protein A2857_01250 [Candidatus Levybacteria bacterium RIFCSPHIGHO2_01_FULL_36_15]|nr:MAG: hypothetical protein A2857_01250 [Candidatus Levybacteria bacterium RIFCSPHIGHO2_01_FULL_36_15]